MQQWRLLETEGMSGMNMAIDEAILEAKIQNKAPNTLRFYSWKPPTITLGYFLHPEKEINLEAAKGIPVIRRITGGGAVLHDEEITYSLIVDETLVPKQVLSSYKAILGAIIKALAQFGVTATHKPINDILVNGNKLSGNAQTRKEGVMLHHGTILLKGNREKINALFPKAQEQQSQVIGLKEIFPEINVENVKKRMKKAFEELFNCEFVSQPLNKEEEKLAEVLHKTKYESII